MSTPRNRSVALAAMLTSLACLTATGCQSLSAFGGSGGGSKGGASASASPSASSDGYSPAVEKQLLSTPSSEVITEAIDDTLSSPQYSYTGFLDDKKAGNLGITHSYKDGICKDTSGTLSSDGQYPDGTSTVIVQGENVWVGLDEQYLVANLGKAQGEAKWKLLNGRYLKYASYDQTAQQEAAVCTGVRQAWLSWTQPKHGFNKAQGQATTRDGQRVIDYAPDPGEEIDISDSSRPVLLSVRLNASDTEDLGYEYSYGPVNVAAPSQSQSLLTSS